MSIKICERLSELIADNNLTADALGKKINVSGSIVARWIRENKHIKLVNLLKLSEFFNSSVDFMCGRTENKGVFINTPPTFPDRLMLLLDNCNQTKCNVFYKIGFNRHVIYDWAKGTPPLSSALIALADYFDCSIDFLLGIEN